TLSRLSLARNQLTTLPPTHLWRCDLLFELDLANNQLEERFHDANGSRFLPLPLFRRNLVYDYELKIPKLTGLHRLILGGNRLHRVPPSVCQLAMLETLDISGQQPHPADPGGAGPVRQLMRLVCDPGQLQEPLRQFVQKSFVSTIPLLNHLRLQLYRTSPYYHLKLVVAGNGRPGTRQAGARGERSHWSLDRVVQQNYIRNAEAPLRRNLRDTLLQPPARIFHLQMTRRDLVDAHRRVAPRRGSRDLRAAKLAPSIVIAIGQNLPPGEEFSVDELFLTLAEKPDDQAIARLRWTVLKWSLEVPCPDDVKRGRVIGRQLPMFFINAMELVVQRFEAIQGCHSAQRYVPLITEDEMLELLKEAAKNCEVPSQAFEKAIDFMPRAGPAAAHPRRLQSLPVLPRRGVVPFVLQSVVLFKSTPAVPQRPGRAPDRAAGPEYPCRALLRVYRFPYFPPGLWPRLAARLHATVADLKERARFFYAGNRRRDQPRLLADSPARPPGCCTPPPSGRPTPSRFSAGAAARSAAGSASCSASDQHLLLARGFMVKHDDGRFGIQLGDSGVELELVDLLLDTWFPGLASFEEDGYADVAEDDGERATPMKGCGYRTGAPRCTGWAYRLCAERALTGPAGWLPCAAACGRPRSRAASCRSCCFADVDRSAIVEAGRLRLRREPDCLLGEGAFGSVYRAWVQFPVAEAPPARGVWKAPAPPTRRPRRNRRADSLVQLERARRLDQAIDGLKRMRHEANVLQALRSPFLVAFRGICLEPLCFLTELAPLGLSG
uniref:Protein kinase domain-containing protein n=1 Tax=Macrostomum lignano TaxID=282301 RepID=A0A1I8JPI8_9PLAT